MDKSLVIFTSIVAIITMLLGAQFYIQPKDVPIIEEATNKPSEIQNNLSTVNAAEMPVNLNANNNTTVSTTEVPINLATKVPIVMYHAVGDGPNDLFLQTNLFEQQIEYLSKNNYNFIDFEDIKNRKIPSKPILLTFDDGYKDVYDNAYPILKKYNVKATIFLISKTIGTPDYLSLQDISEMNSIISFQSHSVSHPDLRELDIDKLEYEIRVSKETIQGIVNNNVIAFCYPSGKFNENIIDITKKYYNYGISTVSGFYTFKDDSYIMKRIRINKGDTLNILKKKLLY